MTVICTGEVAVDVVCSVAVSEHAATKDSRAIHVVDLPPFIQQRYQLWHCLFHVLVVAQVWDYEDAGPDARE